MNCQICFEIFSLENQNKIPRVLIQCGHTFCDQCIRNQMGFQKQIECKQCKRINILPIEGVFPVNENLLAVLEGNKQTQIIKQQELCKIHSKKLQAYCQNQQIMLCLNCVLTNHKNHRVVSTIEKVECDKQLMKNCHKKILKSKQFLLSKLQQSFNLKDKLNLDLNEYIFEINLFYKNIISQFRQSEQKYILQTKMIIQKAIKQIQVAQQGINQKKNFYQELQSIYSQINEKTRVQYLLQKNKRIFILQNCSIKDKFVFNYKKQQINKEKILTDSIKALQQIINYEKKQVGNISNRKITTFQNQYKQESQIKKNSFKQDSSNKQSSGQNPLKLQKKNVSSTNKTYKQPQVLQVNLLQKYQKYQQSKGMKKRNSEYLVSSHVIKSPKIQYEVKRQEEIVSKQYTRKNSGSVYNNIYDRQENYEKADYSSRKKIQQRENSQNIKNSNITKEEISSPSRDQFMLSFLNQSASFSSPTRNIDKTFQIETPLSINSFMQSSRFTIHDDNVSTFNRQYGDETVLKDSRTSFTMFCIQQKIYHLGGIKNDSIDCLKLQNSTKNKIELIKENVLKGFNKSKFQCVIMSNYSPNKCLILGGKDASGQKTKQIMQFNFKNYKVQKSPFELLEPISGFGSVVNLKRLYVFGGSTNQALKTMHQYRIGRTGFQVKKVPSMINTRDQLGYALGFDGYIYACGGINSSNVILNSCERYCFKSNKWSSIQAMKIPRRSFVLMSLPNGIYAIGGHDGKSFLKQVEMFDYEQNKWIQITPLNQGRFTHSAISTKDYQNIIIFGGFQNQPSKSVQIFNVLQNKWSFLNDMQSQRYLHCSISYQS